MGAANAKALALIDRWPDWPARTVLIAGPVGSEWRRLLLVERAMLVAPLCDRCGDFHLRAGRYGFDGAAVQAFSPAGLEPYAFRRLVSSGCGGCPEGPDDWRVRLDLLEVSE